MTAPTNTQLTTATIGNREDLIDTITRVSPSETPLFSMLGKTKASATLHEWQTQALAAPAANEQVEGDDATAIAATPTVRLTNRTQISTKTAIVSGSQEAANSAGRKSEMGYQMSLKSLELKRDMEFGMFQNAVLATAPRRSRGLLGWSADNVSVGAGGVAANYVTNTAQTDGTTRALTETLLKTVLQSVYTAGGDPTVAFMSAANKQTFSAFSGNSTRFDKGEDKRLVAAIDVYVSDFGEIKAVPSRHIRSRDMFIIDPSKYNVAYYRSFSQKPLAVTGDSEKRMLTVEYCLEALAPNSGAAILDLT